MRLGTRPRMALRPFQCPARREPPPLRRKHRNFGRCWDKKKIVLRGQVLKRKSRAGGAKAGAETASAALHRRNERYHLSNGRGARMGNFRAAIASLGCPGKAAGDL